MCTANFDTELLIATIESRPCLWDKSDEKYKDKLKTNTAWKEVCCIFKEDFAHLNDKEKTLFGEYINLFVQLKYFQNKITYLHY